MAKKLILPRVHVMVACDDVDDSPDEEDVFTLSGVRTRIRAPDFPYTRPQMWVYLQVTGHAGATRCRVEVLNAESDEVVYVGPDREIELEGPLVVLPFVLRLRNCKFPTAGVYYLQVYSEQKLLGERLLVLDEE